jgi:uncharacterized flavoprotein (TIGR03862 family)
MEPDDTPDVAVIGAGPAGLMAATVLAESGIRATVYEKMPTAGRKLLMAGRGGLNLTHSEPLPDFLSRYREAEGFLAPLIAGFGPAELRGFSARLGEDTFVGSSGRVFPQSVKASPLLRAWLRLLAERGVPLKTRHEFRGFDDDMHPLIAAQGGPAKAIASRATILALGGASWPKLGADGAWQQALGAIGVPVSPLTPSNCGFRLAWSAHMQRFAGEALKRIVLSFGDETAKGEAIITQSGVEGGVFYALSAPIRDAIARQGAATPMLDLRPDLPAEALAKRLAAVPRAQSLSNRLRKAAGLAPAAIALLREATGNALPEQPEALAALIKAVPLRLTGIEPLERAISSAGGVALSAVDERLMLRAHPGLFIAGEMLDWEAPTGGYLLQACFATGFAAGHGAAAWLTAR